MASEMEEKLIILQTQIRDRNKIEAKDMAGFCAAAYKALGDNYNEELFVKTNKQIMNFFNRGIKNILSPELVESVDSVLEQCEIIKNGILNKLGKSDVDVEPASYENIKLEDITSEYIALKKQYSEIKDKKRPFLFRGKWKKEQLNFYAKIDGFEKAVKELLQKETESKERKNLKQEKERIVENVKKLLAGYNDDIGVALAGWTFEIILSSEKELQNYIGEGLLPELAGYVVNKSE